MLTHRPSRSEIDPAGTSDGDTASAGLPLRTPVREPPVAQATQPADRRRGVVQRLRLTDQPRDQLVVLGEGMAEVLAHGHVLRTEVLEPRSLEVQDRAVFLAQLGHAASMPARP